VPLELLRTKHQSQSYNLQIYSTSYVTWTRRNGGCTKNMF